MSGAGPTEKAERSLRRRLSPAPQAAAQARRWVDQMCSSWGLQVLAEDAQTVVSELVTNAIHHAGGSIELGLERIGDGLRVEVSDDSPQPARPVPAMPLAESGRGLLLVAALTTRWSTEPQDDGKRVVAELHPPARS